MQRSKREAQDLERNGPEPDGLLEKRGLPGNVQETGGQSLITVQATHLAVGPGRGDLEGQAAVGRDNHVIGVDAVHVRVLQ